MSSERNAAAWNVLMLMLTLIDCLAGFVFLIVLASSILGERSGL